ncbi:MAG: hypothetical protein ACKO81_01100, partial [Planctomycetota bacterium]
EIAPEVGRTSSPSVSVGWTSSPSNHTERTSVVTARFITREVNTIARAEIIGPDGTIKMIEGTPIHPIWSVDRNDWVPLGAAQEKVSGTNGTAEECKFSAERAEALLTPDQFFGILAVVW